MEEFMTSLAIWEGLMEEEPEFGVWVGSDQWSLWNGVPGEAEAHRWESLRKVLGT